VQPGHPTIQGVLRDALARITGEDVLPQGSGRTDAGVHALGQVASFALAAPIPEANLARALNRTLPAAIRDQPRKRWSYCQPTLTFEGHRAGDQYLNP